MTNETEQIRERYLRREAMGADSRYDPVDPYVVRSLCARELVLARWVRRAKLMPLRNKTLLEIGCGNGSNLLRFLQLGFRPENLVANELLEHRAAEARHRLPQATQVLTGDARELNLADASFDVVFQSTVFSSILDPQFQRQLAQRMWSLVRGGGGVLWYDFVYNNPSNPDVRGVPLRRVRELFPSAEILAWRVTLAPPIGRRVASRAPWLYPLLSALPFLRTHILCWIRKPAGHRDTKP